MTRSMTGYASGTDQGGGYAWTWDVRSVNGRGLDLRLRVPDWIEGLEPAVRSEIQKRVVRGSLSLSLRVEREKSQNPVLDLEALQAAIALVRQAEDEAASGDLALERVSAADLLQMRGVLTMEAAQDDTTELRTALLEDLAALLDLFEASRAQEGRKLEQVLREQFDEIATLLVDARQAAADRQSSLPERLGAALERLKGAAGDVDEVRMLQEVAVLATRADVTEELDRLDTHLVAARELVSAESAKGRKLDFLIQEFNREANTLCSKSQSAPLTQVGLALKVVIDQVREQVQNIE